MPTLRGVCLGTNKWHGTNTRLISWADLRTQQAVDALGSKHQFVTDRTGLPVNAHYAASKISLLQSQLPNPNIQIGTLDSYLLHRFSNGKIFAVEEAMAARTLLYDLTDAGWSSELCEVFDVDLGRLPSIIASFGDFISIGGIPVQAVIPDAQAGLLSISACNRGCLLNLGTVGSFLVPTGSELRREEGYISGVLVS